MQPRLISTALGTVEVGLSPGDGEVVLFFPGGHTTARTPLGTDIYSDLGYRVLTFSRPGYGGTDVGALTAAEFVPAVAEVCTRLGISTAAATVGVSFGGLQAVQVAANLGHLAPRLILHSAAPSALPYPDTVAERLAVPFAFGRRSQRLTWRMVRALTSGDGGLRLMMRTLSTRPVRSWWHHWTPADRQSARQTFARMDSGSGFLTDIAQATRARSDYRASVLASVRCPTLITASRFDGGVDFGHADSFQRLIPGARLVDTEAPSHFFWIGPSRDVVFGAVRDFMAVGV